jgi:ATP/maltotriose-dependent transcriptional regulator MalT
VATIPPTPRTKYRPPESVAGLVDRQRLLDRLEPGRDRRLTLIHAPAGFGKTTLAGQFSNLLTAADQPVAWISIDHDDDNPVWLLAHLIEAVGSVRPDWVENLRMLLEQHVDDAARYVLPALINKIDTSGAPLFVIVDDWHRVSDPRAVAVMEVLLDQASPLLHVVITSRAHKALPLGRLRVRDQLVEVDESMLRFDAAESERLLVDIKGLPLVDDDIEGLMGTTDGWVAALQLVSLSLRGEQDVSEQIRDLSGRDTSIEAYLAENVLDRLASPTLEILLRTALPERLSADLVTALTGERQGQAILEQIEKDDLFLRPLDATRTWFRYHHLFVEFLRRRLERDHPDEIPDLHRKAADWFAAHDLTSEAVDHALAAGDPGYAVDIVTDRAMTLFNESGMTILLALVEKLPPALAADRPQLQLALGWANTLLQRPEEALRAVGNLERSLRLGTDPGIGPEQAASLLLESRILRASFTGHADQFAGLPEVAKECLEQAETLPAWPVTLAACLDTFSELHCFRFGAARRRQLWARPYFERTVGFAIGGLGLCLAGIAALEELDAEGARKHLNLALQWGERGGSRRSYMPQMAVAQLGAVAYLRGELETAEQYLSESEEFGENGLTDYILPNRVIAPRLKAFRGDLRAAEELLTQGAATARDLGLDRLAAAVIEEQARLGFRSLFPEPEVPGLIGGPQDGISFAIADSLETARILRSLRVVTPTEARDLVPDARKMLARIESQQRPLAALRAQVLLAATLHRAGWGQEAAEQLIVAIRTADRTGLISPITDGGSPIAELLADLITAARTAGRVQVVENVPNQLLTLLQRRAAEWNRAWTRAEADSPLTERETEILGLLDRGRTNQQIARTLNLSTNTVKWYLKALYLKFDVTRRQECVAAARSAHLLPDP